MLAIVKEYGRSAVGPLLSKLDDDKCWPVLILCFKELKEESLPDLLKIIDEKNPKHRYRAVFLLRNNAAYAKNPQDTEKLLKTFVKLCEDPVPGVMINGIRGLGALGGHAQSELPFLSSLLASPNPGVQVTAIQAIASIGKSDEELREKLIEIFQKEENPTIVRYHALKCLMRLETGRRVIASAISQKPGSEQAAKRLSDVIKAVIPLLGSNDTALAIYAGKLLASLKTHALSGLENVLSQGNNRAQRFAIFAITKMGNEGKPALPKILSLLEDKDPLIERNAIESVGYLGTLKDAEKILPFLESDNTEIKSMAMTALETLGAGDVSISAAVEKARVGLKKENVSEVEKSPGTEGKPGDYAVGGPVAGLKLPLFKGQYGERPGYPGCIPAVAKRAQKEYDEKRKKDPSLPETGQLNKLFTEVGQYPEYELYPGSVEHWRSYDMKYLNARSLYDRQSQVKNWVAPDIPGATSAQKTTFAEPVWVPRWGSYHDTGKKCKPVPVISYHVGDAPLKLDFGKLQRGVYCVRIIAAVPTDELTPFRKNLLVRFTVNDGLKGEMHTYVKRENYTDNLYSISEMFFHAPETRKYQGELSLANGSNIGVLIHNISLDDCLTGQTRKAIKRKVTLKENVDYLPTL